MIKRWTIHFCLPLALLLAFELLVAAHPVPYSYLDLHLREKSFEGKLTLHTIDLAHDLGLAENALLDPASLAPQRDAIIGLVRDRLHIVADGRSLDPLLVGLEPEADLQAVVLSLRYDPTARVGRIDIDCRLFPYDAQHQTFLNLYQGETLLQQQIFSATRERFEYFTGTRDGVREVLRKFIPAGIHHIFVGPDHILFLIGLLLLGGSLRRLLLIVTAFTIAHSITLSLAALDLLDVQASIIEPAIALSIVYVGIDNLMVEKGSRDLRAWIAFFFGFIHGFGFAGVLREFGLPAQALGWSLFSFNLGVEIGQGVIVVVVATILALVKKRWPEQNRLIVMIASTGIILSGAYWFITRVFF